MMRRNTEEGEDYIKLVFLYMEYRNTFNLHFQRYGHFKQMIRYITNITEPAWIRWIFQKLLNRKYFIKKKSGKMTLYHFNPYNKTYPKRPLIITFD